MPAEAALEHLGAAVAGLAVSRAGLIRPEQWHLTVAFLGEVPDGRLEAVSAAVATGAAAGRAGTLAVSGGGQFGDAVLWAGLSGDVEALTETAGAVAREVTKAGVTLERRPYRPHLTLARPRNRVSREELEADLQKLAAYTGPEWLADRIFLVRTERSGQQTRYDTLAGWPLPTHQA
jgi:2'-5' RNA ligase